MKLLSSNDEYFEDYSTLLYISRDLSIEAFLLTTKSVVRHVCRFCVHPQQSKNCWFREVNQGSKNIRVLVPTSIFVSVEYRISAFELLLQWPATTAHLHIRHPAEPNQRTAHLGKRCAILKPAKRFLIHSTYIYIYILNTSRHFFHFYFTHQLLSKDSGRPRSPHRGCSDEAVSTCSCEFPWAH